MPTPAQIAERIYPCSIDQIRIAVGGISAKALSAALAKVDVLRPYEHAIIPRDLLLVAAMMIDHLPRSPHKAIRSERRGKRRPKARLKAVPYVPTERDNLRLWMEGHSTTRVVDGLSDRTQAGVPTVPDDPLGGFATD